MLQQIVLKLLYGRLTRTAIRHPRDFVKGEQVDLASQSGMSWTRRLASARVSFTSRSKTYSKVMRCRMASGKARQAASKVAMGYGLLIGMICVRTASVVALSET